MFNLRRVLPLTGGLWTAGSDDDHTIDRLERLPDGAKFQPYKKQWFLQQGVLFVLLGPFTLWQAPYTNETVSWVLSPIFTLAGIYWLLKSFFVPTYFVTANSLARSGWGKAYRIEAARIASWTIDDSKRARKIRLKLTSGEDVKLLSNEHWEAAVEGLLGPSCSPDEFDG
jgi:hypothetical protein